MITFRSKPKHQTFRLTNSSKKPLNVMTELWCESFSLQAGEILEAKALVADLADPINPLNFEIVLEDDYVSLWCAYATEFQIIEAEKNETAPS